MSFYSHAKTETLKRAGAASTDADRGLEREVTTVTVEGHMLDWLEPLRPTVRNSTFRSCEGHVPVWIIPFLGRLKLTDLTPAHVRAMLTEVAEAGRSDGTIVRIRATLSSALGQAQVDRGLTRNVASRPGRPSRRCPPTGART